MFSLLSVAVLVSSVYADVVKCPLGVGPDLGKFYTEHNPVLVDLKVGSQEAPVKVAIDSGSYDLWVPLPSADDPLPKYGVYDPNDSKSSVFTNKSKSVAYGYKRKQGDVEFYSDVVKIGGVSVNTTFGVSNSTNVRFPIIGLGEAQQDFEFPSIFQTMKDQGIIRTTGWSLYLADDYTGELLFGGIDDAKYEGELYTVPNSGFGFQSPQFRIGDTNYEYNSKVIVDSGWNVGFGFPHKLGSKINDEWKAMSSADQCEGPADYSFEIHAEHGSIEIFVKDMLRKRTDGQCYLDIGDTDAGLVIGLKGFQHVYISANFEENTFSFAKKVNTNDTKIREL